MSMNCESEANLQTPTNLECLNLGYSKEGISKLQEIDFGFLTEPSSQSQATQALFSFEEEAILNSECPSSLNLRVTVSNGQAQDAGSQVNQAINIFEHCDQFSNMMFLHAAFSNSSSGEEQGRRNNAVETLNPSMEVEMNHFTPAIQGQGEVSTQVASPNVSETTEVQQKVTRRRGRPAKTVKCSMEEELMKNDLNNADQDYVPLKQQKNIQTTKKISKKNQLKLENRDEKLNRLPGFRNFISLIGKAVQNFTESDEGFRNQLRMRLEGAELRPVTDYLTENIKGRKAEKDQSKLSSKKNVADLLKIRNDDNYEEAQKKRGAMTAFELFLDGEFYNIWLNGHYEKKWAGQGEKGESQRKAFIVFKDQIRSTFLDLE